MAELDPQSGSQDPVDPAQAQGAQIPLPAFAIPDFPPEAKELKALTLTSDIKIDEYPKQLESFTPIPALPQGVQSLTLELFSLGYPAGFLSALAEALPHVRSFDAYSQLLCGITAEAQEDAVAFFDKLRDLRAIQLLDVFARPGFFQTVGEKLTARAQDQRLMFLQFNYTFRHEDEDFLRRIPAEELPAFVNPSLVMCSFNVAAPDNTDDPEDPTNVSEEGEVQQKPEGVMAFHKSHANHLVYTLTDEKTAPTALRALNTTLYTFTVDDLETVLQKHTGLLMISMTLEIEPTEMCKNRLLEALRHCPEIERVEIVGNPTLEFSMAVMNPRRKALDHTFPSADDMRKLEESCPKLTHFSATILRTTSSGHVEWSKEGGSWQGGITTPALPDDGTADMPPALVATLQQQTTV
ncbi:hypothetical protein SLS58_002115 [Diplodia intermedia]|uniref:Uncharacterized protein n=1 Tax=Diplodia intermedia TaxID=856260 RepID=A0ABR3U0P1_9PEZI